MQIMAERNVKRPDHTYTTYNDNNYFRRSLNAQKTGLFRICERLESPDSRKSQNYRDDFVKKYKLCNYSLNLGKMAIRSNTVGTTSEDGYKHFRRPILPFIISKLQTADIPHYSEHEVLNGILQNARKQCYTVSPKSELYKNVETQTDYRESEAQTEPWEPPYKIVPGHTPEILTLANLTWEHGLPAGIYEIHVINRMRIRKTWEAILPPMDTPANIRMRNSIITALEIDEWAFRESEIQFIMDLRLKLMRDLLQSRELECTKKVQSRFGRLQDKLGKHRDDQVKTIRRNLERDLRKLCRKNRDKQHPCKADIIEQHSDPKSDLYAPLIRFGEHPQRRHEILQKNFLNENYIQQEEEEEEQDTTLSWLPTLEESKTFKRKTNKPVDICIRETRWTEEKLKKLHSDLKVIRLNDKSVDVLPKLMKRNYKQPSLPVTPRRSGMWDNKKQKKQEESATFIQKIVKGKAVQCLMNEGRDRCKELIEELQSTQALEQHGQQDRRDERMHMIELQRLQNDKSIQEDRLCEILNSLEGKTVCGILDFLSKELVRLEDERLAHAFALLAEREKCMKEAAEAGRRQMERNRRREFDEMFKQIVKVNQDSVETYLEDIIKEGIDWISDKTAKEYTLELCDQVDTISKLNTFENANDLAKEELIADMIYNSVLLEVEKHNTRKKIRDQQQSYMRNAHISIYEKILNLPSVELSQFMDQEVCIKSEDIQAIHIDTEQDMETGEIESLIYLTGIKDKK